MKFIKPYIFPVLTLIAALSVSGSAAFYSITGLSKLFSGASLEVTIMATALEIAKIITAVYLHKHWKAMNRFLRGYLLTATIALILITSMGIYGFLSSAYQDTYNQYKVTENRIGFLKQKEEFYSEDLQRLDLELATINQSINNLSNAKAREIQVRDTTSSTGFRNTISTAELRLAESRISSEEGKRVEVQSKRQSIADSVQKYQLQVLELESNTELAAELGPLKYLASLTGWSMDKVVNILLIVIVFVFDPLAIALVTAANFAFDKIQIRRNLYNETQIIEGKLPNLYPETVKEDTPVEEPQHPSEIGGEEVEKILSENNKETVYLLKNGDKKVVNKK